MKFQVKALVAALALSVSGLASAANTVVSGDGTLWLSVFDRTNNKAVVFDTGYTYATLNELGNGASSGFDAANATLTFDLSSNAAYQTFIAGIDASNTYYNIAAGDTFSVPAAQVGGKGYLSSYALGSTVDFSTVTRTGLSNNINNFQSFAVNNTDPFIFFANDNFGLIGPTSIALVGTDMGLYQAVQNTTISSSAFEYVNTKVSFNTGVLTISSVQSVTTPVPEPETFALMGLGFSLVAAAARRRKANK